jgi:type IV pilus assembly protein PilM
MMDLRQQVDIRQAARAVARRFHRPQRSSASVSGRVSRGSVNPRSARRLVGLKVGASQIAAAYAANNGSIEILQLARQELQAGVVVNGELREPDALVEALRAFFKKSRLPRRDVRLGISGNRIGVRTLLLSGMESDRQVENAVRFRAQEVLPVPPEDAVLDYRVLREETREDGKRDCHVLLVGAHRDLVARYADACKRAGIRLIGIDLEAFALARALAPRPEPGTEAAVAAVGIGHERTTLAITDGTACELTRVVEWGGATINLEIARAINVTPSEAEPIKRALSLPFGGDADVLGAARSAALDEVQRFSRELVASLAYYQNQPTALPISEMVVTGGTSHLDGLADELERLAGLPVRVGDPLQHVRIAKGVRVPDQIGSLSTAIGLAIED